MKSFSSKFFFFFFFLLPGFKANAQVIAQDSLALVAFYNATNGSNWYRNTNWLMEPVGTWEGVVIVASRVQTLALVANNISGDFPDEFCDLSGLEYIYLSNNHLTGNLPACIGNMVAINSIDLSNNDLSGSFPTAFATAMPDLADIWISFNQFTSFPDLTGVAQLSNLSIDHNALSFGDVVPNASIANLNYVYSPQAAQAQIGPDIQISIFDPFMVQVTMSGVNNTYQWQANTIDVVDNEHISGATTNTLHNTGARLEDGGFYSCWVSNPAVPLLTIEIVSSWVQVIDNRLPQSLNFPKDTSMFCGTDFIDLPDSTVQNRGVFYSNIEGNALVDGTNRVYANFPGTGKIRVFEPGSVTYLPFDDTIYVTVATHNPIPAFSIQHDLPIYEGEELTLSVPFIPGVTYSWTTPDLQNEQTSSITRPAGTPGVEGVYKVKISEGSCFYDSLEITVTFAIDTDIVIYELITPNGDGDNETFYIENLQALPSVDVTVFNVWHQVVYNEEQYDNNWDGGGLPVGTYYYLLKVKEWDKVYKGNLYIKR